MSFLQCFRYGILGGLLLLFFSLPSWATHNRAGEITYKSLGNLAYEVKIITYTYTPSDADRPELGISWGDGSVDTIRRTGEVYLGNEIKRNEYLARHQYAAVGTYVLSFEDPNRNGGVVNIPNSINVPFYVESLLTVNPFLGDNSSPQLLYPPVDVGCVGQPFIHNPAAFDPDGDSLSYKLIKCRGEEGKEIINYQYPVGNNSFSLNPVNGDIYWDSPTLQGEFNVAMMIEEWRNGVRIGYVIRDLQVEITPCDNDKPTIEVLENYCVQAGDTLQFSIAASDPNNDKVTLMAYGGPMELSDLPAVFETVSGQGEVVGDFIWTTHCDHVRQQSYDLVFKAVDQDAMADLVDIKTVHIQVVAPAPEGLIASSIKDAVVLNWDDYICANATTVQIYRKPGGKSFPFEECVTGIPAASGYELIAETGNASQTTFTDDDEGRGLVNGLRYCYRLVAVFKDGAESYASEEACAELVDDRPAMTHVSVLETDDAKGVVYTAWSRPTEFDSLRYPPPYRYQLEVYNDAEQQFETIKLLNDIRDTVFVDSALNTADQSRQYRVVLYSKEIDGNEYIPVGNSAPAQSVFLKIMPRDNALELQWETAVPWVNDTFVVYRQGAQNVAFDSIGVTTKNHYLDRGVENKKTYCYYIKSIGGYYTDGFVYPIINLSQQSCAEPVDLIPPCSPDFMLMSDCKNKENTLYWDAPLDSCEVDISFYSVYFKSDLLAPYQKIKGLVPRGVNQYIHSVDNNIVGCYRLSATDSTGNESVQNNEVCIDVDSCELFRLPMVFTPNDDSFNDLFSSLPFDYVERIEIKIFNRWGGLVFATEDPKVDWDGKNYLTHLNCSEGVYYYVCDVYEKRLSGLQKRELTGFIHLIR